MTRRACQREYSVESFCAVKNRRRAHYPALDLGFGWRDFFWAFRNRSKTQCARILGGAGVSSTNLYLKHRTVSCVSINKCNMSNYDHAIVGPCLGQPCVRWAPWKALSSLGALGFPEIPEVPRAPVACSPGPPVTG